MNLRLRVTKISSDETGETIEFAPVQAQVSERADGMGKDEHGNDVYAPIHGDGHSMEIGSQFVLSAHAANGFVAGLPISDPALAEFAEPLKAIKAKLDAMIAEQAAIKGVTLPPTAAISVSVRHPGDRGPAGAFKLGVEYDIAEVVHPAP